MNCYDTASTSVLFQSSFGLIHAIKANPKIKHTLSTNRQEYKIQ